MKVLEQGNYNDQFPMKIICRRVEDQYGLGYGEPKDFCGSTLEIEEKDIKKHRWSKYPDMKGTDYGVICPICKQFIVVDKKNICKTVLDNAEEIFIDSI